MDDGVHSNGLTCTVVAMWLTTLDIRLDTGPLHAARVGDEVTVCGEAVVMELRYRWPLGPDWPVCGECARALLALETEQPRR